MPNNPIHWHVEKLIRARLHASINWDSGVTGTYEAGLPVHGRVIGGWVGADLPFGLIRTLSPATDMTRERLTSGIEAVHRLDYEVVVVTAQDSYVHITSEPQAIYDQLHDYEAPLDTASHIAHFYCTRPTKWREVHATYTLRATGWNVRVWLLPNPNKLWLWQPASLMFGPATGQENHANKYGEAIYTRRYFGTSGVGGVDTLLATVNGLWYDPDTWNAYKLNGLQKFYYYPQGQVSGKPYVFSDSAHVDAETWHAQDDMIRTKLTLTGTTLTFGLVP